MIHTLKNYKNEKTEQKKANNFRVNVICKMNNNKKEYYGQELENGMKITGIGKKCLKIENNFYTWEDIEEAINGTENEIMKNILAFIFEDYNLNKETYTARKFTRTEAIHNFNEIKKEIIDHKEYYKTDYITGIGEKAVMIGKGYEAEYTNWEKIKEAILNNTIKDFKVTHYKGHYTTLILEHFFIDDIEETSTEKNIKEEEYGEEKAYIYRQLLQESLTVEKIRGMIYERHNYNEAEEIINECLQFAFHYTSEIKFTDEDYDTKESNKYAIKQGNTYAYIYKNKQIRYDEEKTGYYFKGSKKVLFTTEGTEIIVHRNGEEVHRQQGGVRDMIISMRNKNIREAYVLSVEQQLQMMEEQGIIRKIEESDIKQEFEETVEGENTIGYELSKIIAELYEGDFQKAYENNNALRQLAKELYKQNKIHEVEFYRILESIRLEKEIDLTKILEIMEWDAGNSKKASLTEDKYKLESEKGKTIIKGFFEYTYAQNCEYTFISHSRSSVDTFTVTDVYLEGDINEEDAVKYCRYVEGVTSISNVLQHMYIYEGYSKKWNNHWINKY